VSESVTFRLSPEEYHEAKRIAEMASMTIIFFPHMGLICKKILIKIYLMGIQNYRFYFHVLVMV
jgi:hypothetical protein